MDIQVDISADEADESPVTIAPDVDFDAYEVSLGALKLTINHAQMQRMYLQLRPWFEEKTQ